jgi:hypothetical protein
MRVLEQSIERWLVDAEAELANAERAWATGNAGMGRVSSRRAAGMALKAWLGAAPREGYGQSYMHHLNALADDSSFEASPREAAWRLCARPRPEAGFVVDTAPGLTPMLDARLLMDWARAQVQRVSEAP